MRVIEAHRSTALAALACGALAGCTLVTDSFRTNEFSGDPFPIHVGTESGAVMIGVREPDGPQLDAVLDVLSPVTITDPGVERPKSLTTSDLILLGRGEPAAAAFEVPRARLRAAEVISLHPCEVDEPLCAVGRPGATQPYGAIIGANVLAGDALRLRLSDQQAFLLADVGGDDRDRTFVCDSVFPSPYRGGGTLIIANTEVPFGGRRITLQACLGADLDPDPVPAPDPDPEPNTQGPLVQSARGGDALLVMSTGIGISLLGKTAYQRYRQSLLLRQQYSRRIPPPPPPPPPLEALPDGSAYLPSGLVFGKLGTIDRIALAAASSSSPRAPCRQAYAHRLLTEHKRCQPGDDCPCADGKEFCSVPAVVELQPTSGLQVLVVSDDNPTLQALRAELRPDQPEVDGILGADALRLAEVDIDYPHNRLLTRCTSPEPACVARPALASEDDLTQVRQCLGLEP